MNIVCTGANKTQKQVLNCLMTIILLSQLTYFHKQTHLTQLCMDSKYLQILKQEKPG